MQPSAWMSGSRCSARKSTAAATGRFRSRTWPASASPASKHRKATAATCGRWGARSCCCGWTIMRVMRRASTQRVPARKASPDECPQPPVERFPMLLMIDNYDSFTWNLVQYLQALGAEVKVVRNDELTVAQIDALAPERIV